jgi:preprotein translocase subunit SecD
MKSWRWNINGIFWACTLAALLCGCETTEEKKEKKEQTLLNLHMEMVPDGSKRDAPVPVFRQRPEMVTIDTTPFLNNSSVKGAEMVDVEGGYGIRIEFDGHGRGVLEAFTARNVGKRIAVYAAWPEVRWLAAPRIKRRIADGVFIFTPDATREESERIVRGINNVAKKVSKGRWP